MFTEDQDFVYIMGKTKNENEILRDLDGVWVKNKGHKFPKNFWCMNELEKYFPQLKTNVGFQNTKDKLELSFATLITLKTKEIVSNPKLRPYQNQDVFYLFNMPAAGVFNEPRTGKTPTTIELIRTLGAQKNIIICPASLIWNWKKEFEQWYPEHYTVVVNGSKKDRADTYEWFSLSTSKATLIISKDTFKQDRPSMEFEVAVVDEAHFLRNHNSAQSKAICGIRAKRKYALTGTPTVKHAADIYGIMKFLYPSKFSSYWAFVGRYFHTYNNGFGQKLADVKRHRKTELQEMIGLMSVQRKRKDVMQWLPDKQWITIPIIMGKKQCGLYDQMSSDFFAMDDEQEHSIDAMTALTKLLRLRQLSLDPRLVGFDVAGAKTDAILEYLEDNKEPVVIMSMFTSYLKLIASLLPAKVDYGMITGETSTLVRQKSVEAFQKGKLNVIFCNIIAAGVGLTLDRAETIIFTDKAWNPADNEQAEDRITPVSKERNHKHSIITFESMASVDAHMNKLLYEKKSLTNLVNEGGIQAVKKLIRGVL
jgi:SNF2 family DNA or RNA helicase